MKIPFTEPTAPRYIYINPVSNKVHLMMPVVSGTEIGLDNTCKSVSSLMEFFGKSTDATRKTAYDELIAYKAALEFDMSLIAYESELKAKKEERLEQINCYIVSIETVQKSDVLTGLTTAFPTYPQPLQRLMQEQDTNLYSMVLRPENMDSWLRFVNPVFSVKREGDSLFFQRLQQDYKSIDFSALPNAKARLYTAVLASLDGSFDFEKIQRVLTQESKKLFKVDINFHKDMENKTVTKDYVDDIMFRDESTPPVTASEYIEDLIGLCAPRLFDTIEQSPFYCVKTAEELSVLTQFFLGILNIHCFSNKSTTANFGAVLDASENLSKEITALISSALTRGSNIEEVLLNYVDANSVAFGLTKELASCDMGDIKKKFTEQYAQIKESPHFDEFIVLDGNKRGSFFTHQGSICVDFAKFTSDAFPLLYPDYFQTIRDDFNEIRGSIPHNNHFIHAAIEVSIEALLETIKDEEQLNALLKKLPKDQQRELMTSPILLKIQLPTFLQYVAQGQQDEAQSLLEINDNANLLLSQETFTDYSGRTFNCTAYEYAYWAKDTHMCRMLEKHMSEDTKARMLELCKVIERDGLNYKQQGEDKNSKHFDFTPLITALDNYEKADVKTSELWMAIGKAQRDAVAHVINEYCGSRTFVDPLPDFNEIALPRRLMFYNSISEKVESFFPLVVSDAHGPGVDFALVVGSGSMGQTSGTYCRGCASNLRMATLEASLDLEAVRLMDEVRTAGLTQSLENLRPIESEHLVGMSR